MMFSCEIGSDKVKWFKEVIKTIYGVVDEIKVESTEKGLKLWNLDRNHIMYVLLELEPDFFEKWDLDTSIPLNYTATIEELYNVLNKHAIQEKFDEYTGELYLIQPNKDQFYWRHLNNGYVYKEYIKNLDKKSFWLETKDLNRVIQRLKLGDTFSLTENTESFIINIEGKSSKQFSISKLDMEYDVGNEPDLPALNALKLSFDSYKEAITDVRLTKYNDKLWFSLEDNKLQLFVEGKHGDIKIKLNADIARADKNLTVKACYSLDRIVRAISGLKECKTELILEFATDTPIRSIYPDNAENGFFKCLIAPRIEAYE